MTAGVGFFFRFDAFEVEIARRKTVFRSEPEVLFGPLRELVGEHLPALNERARIDRLWEVLRGMEYRHGGAGYLLHPLRVAGSLPVFLPEVRGEDLRLALAHNLCEQSGTDPSGPVAEVLGRETVAQIRRLTIDRSRERDSAYLREYYAGIGLLGRGAAVLKAADKLDNLLGWTEKAVDPFYYDVIREHVCPLLGTEDGKLRTYLEDLLSYVSARAPAFVRGGGSGA